MLRISFHNEFKKDYAKIKRRGYKLHLLEEIIEKLIEETPLPVRNRDHALKGTYSGFRECHIAPDWLLIYYIDTKERILYLVRTGTHSDLF